MNGGQDGITGALTKADMRRAVLRTAALTHWRHDFTHKPSPAFSHGAGTSRRAASPCPAGLVDHARGDGAERFAPVSPFHAQEVIQP